MATPISPLPHLRATQNSAQLIVHGKPFLMLPAELHNSSFSSAEYMSTIWPQMKAMNINTLLGSVTWEMIEPIEGQFEFDELDKIIRDAGEYGLHLILLWFGSYKNAKSTYVPGWVKKDITRFPRVRILNDIHQLETIELLTPFNEKAWEADAKAFSTLMRHLKDIDENNSTVLMVQVENECGLLGDSRDRSFLAENAFKRLVPSDLLTYLRKKQSHHPQFQSRWPNFHRDAGGDNCQHSWESLFGKGALADEIFMADAFARYVAQVASAGKEVYNLPLYTNAWLNFEDPALMSDEDRLSLRGAADEGTPIVAGGGSKVGEYPSGGPVPHVLDVWQCHTRNVLDLICPDLYLQDYDWMARQYRYQNQALFIPEQRADEVGARRAWLGYGTYGSLGCSPFGIDSIDVKDSPFTETFGLLGSVGSYILQAQATKAHEMFGFYFDDIEVSKPGREKWTRVIGGFVIVVQRAFVFGTPGPGHGLVIHQGDGKFLLVGVGFQVCFQSTEKSSTFTGILRVEEKTVDADGSLRTLRTLNGDETKGGACVIMPNKNPDYGGFPIRVTIPSRTCIAECTVYRISETV